MVLKPSTTLQEILDNDIAIPEYSPDCSSVYSAIYKLKNAIEFQNKKEDVYSHYEEDDPQRIWLDNHPDCLQDIVNDWTESLDYSFAFSDCYWSTLDDIFERYMGDDYYEN